MADDKSKDAKHEAGKAAATPAAPGGIKAMLPLIITVALMPVLAFVMTQFVILPKIQKTITASATVKEGEAAEHGVNETATEPAAEGAHGSAGEGGAAEGAPKTVAKGAKATYSLPKLIVNMRGSLGTRYLMSSYTLVGKGEEFKTLCKNNDEQMRDVAMGILSAKSIQDLEKPDHRNMIRTELMSTINATLGKPAVQEIYITEFAIQ